MLLRYFLFLLPLLAVASASAQTFSVEGRVVQKDGGGVAFATVTLLKADSSLATGSLADDQGRFTLEAPTGTYTFTAQAVGYGKVRQTLTVNGNQRGLRLELSPTATQLKEVEIKAQKPFLTQDADKTVLNVEGSIIATGMTVLDVLRRAPGVVADQSGNISLRGKAGVLVVIDGKPTQLSGAQLAAFLKSLPSNQVKDIEIMTNPDARYDAQGNAGVINIRLKKGGVEGRTAQLTLTGGTGIYYKSLSNLALSQRTERLNLGLSYTYRNDGDLMDFRLLRRQIENRVALPDKELDSRQDYYVNNTGHNLACVAGYTFKNGLDVELRGMGMLDRNLYDGQIRSLQILNGVPDSLTLSQDYNPDRFDNYTGRVSLSKKYEEDSTRPGKHDLQFYVDYGRYKQYSKQDAVYSTYAPSGELARRTLLLNRLPALTQVQVAAFDYNLPVSKRLHLEMGLKSTTVQVQSDTEVLTGPVDADPVTDETRSSNFRYEEVLAAAYGTARIDLGKLNVRAGLRLERWYALGKQLRNGNSFERDKLYPFPNLRIGYKLDKSNELGLSYSSRIDRPAYNSLNPIAFYADPFNFYAGNPALKPQLTNNVELSHTLMEGTLVTMLNASQTTDIISEYFPTLSADPRVQGIAPQNIGTQHMVGAAVMVYLQILGERSPTQGYANAIYTKYDGQSQGISYAYRGWGLNGNFNQQLWLGHQWTAEVSAFYQSPRPFALGVDQAFGNLSFGIQRAFAKERAMLKLAVQDAFYTMKFRNRRDVAPFYGNSYFAQDSRQVLLTLSYRFGDLKAPKPEVEVEKDERIRGR